MIVMTIPFLKSLIFKMLNPFLQKTKGWRFQIPPGLRLFVTDISVDSRPNKKNTIEIKLCFQISWVAS